MAVWIMVHKAPTHQLLTRFMDGDAFTRNLFEIIVEELYEAAVEVPMLHLMASLEEQSDDVLDHLAWQFHVDFYDAKFERHKKIALIRTAFEAHKYKGTPHALDLVFSNLKLKSNIEEWYQYSGEAYHFRVELYMQKGTDDLELARKLIASYKNVRSWFDGFVILALDQGFLIWDDSYSYPVYYKECNDFWGNAKTINQEVCDVAQVDDSYSYPVYYDDINTTHIKYVNTGAARIGNDSYSYPVYYAECGELSTPDTKSMQFDDDVKMNFEAYDYEVSYQECGDFEAGE